MTRSPEDQGPKHLLNLKIGQEYVDGFGCHIFIMDRMDALFLGVERGEEDDSLTAAYDQHGRCIGFKTATGVAKQIFNTRNFDLVKIKGEET